MISNLLEKEVCWEDNVVNGIEDRIKNVIKVKNGNQDHKEDVTNVYVSNHDCIYYDHFNIDRRNLKSTRTCEEIILKIPFNGKVFVMRLILTI